MVARNCLSTDSRILTEWVHLERRHEDQCCFLHLVIGFVPCIENATIFHSLHVDIYIVHRHKIHHTRVLVIPPPLWTDRCNLCTFPQWPVHAQKHFKMPQALPATFLWVLCHRELNTVPRPETTHPDCFIRECSKPAQCTAVLFFPQEDWRRTSLRSGVTKLHQFIEARPVIVQHSAEHDMPALYPTFEKPVTRGDAVRHESPACRQTNHFRNDIPVFDPLMVTISAKSLKLIAASTSLVSTFSSLALLRFEMSMSFLHRSA